MVGSSILRKLKAAGFNNLVVKSRKHLNLIDGNQVLEFFKENLTCNLNVILKYCIEILIKF